MTTEKNTVKGLAFVLLSAMLNATFTEQFIVLITKKKVV